MESDMNPDTVERLRSRLRLIRRCCDPFEAADEIERLRALATEKMIEADTMRTHHANAEAEVARLQRLCDAYEFGAEGARQELARLREALKDQIRVTVYGNVKRPDVVDALERSGEWERYMAPSAILALQEDEDE